MFNEYPYTDYHELNTDWIIGKIKNVETAEANTKQYAEDADAAKIAAQDAQTAAEDAQRLAEDARDDAHDSEVNAAAIVANTDSQIALLQARVDNIIPDGTQTVGNTELLDIRVAWDSQTYASAGDAVRGQASDNYTRIIDVNSEVAPSLICLDSVHDNDNYLLQAGGAINAFNGIATSRAFACKEGATLTYQLGSRADSAVLAVYDADMNLNTYVAGAGYSTPVSGTYTFTSSDKFFRISAIMADQYYGDFFVDYSYYPQSAVSVSEYEDLVRGALFREPTELKSLLDRVSAVGTANTIYKSSGYISDYHYSDYIALGKGAKIEYSNIRITNCCLIACYDKAKTFDAGNSVLSSGAYSSDGVFTMPYDGFVRLCCRNTELSGAASFLASSPYTADIEELDDRVTALEGGTDLPVIWDAYVTTKIPAIKSALVDIEDHGEAFTFVTDVHVPRNNMLTPKIIRVMNESCPVNYHINGGDFIDLDSTAQEALDTLWTWKDAMSGMTEYCLRGNHDFNNYNGTNTPNEITVGQFYAILDRQIENTVDTAGKTYYVIDNESQKIRIICLDSSLTGADMNTMYAWMQTKLTELDSSWTVLVIQHYLWGNDTSTISYHGQECIDNINAVYGSITAAFVGILAGHTHVDYNDTESVNGYNLIARDTNMIAGGTGTNSLSFDYVTIDTSNRLITFKKIGRGSDLQLSY